jgi:hypothetical protein
MKRLLRPLLLLTVLSGLILSGADGAESTPKNYTANVAPSPVTGGMSRTFSFTFDNKAATQQLGSANVSIPAAWGGTITGVSPSPSGSSFNGTTVFLRNMGVAAGTNKTFQITVSVPCLNAGNTWSVTAKQSNNFNGPPGNTFNLVAPSSLTTEVQCGVDLVFADQPPDVGLDPADSKRSEAVGGATVRAIVRGCSPAPACPTVDVDAAGAVTIGVIAGTSPPVGTGSAPSAAYDLVDGVATISPGPVIGVASGTPVGSYRLTASSTIDPDTNPDATSDEFFVANAVCDHDGTNADTCTLETAFPSFANNRNIGLDVLAENLNNDASGTGSTSLLVTTISAPHPSAQCAGLDPVGPSVEIEVRPLATRTVVTLFIPKQVRQFTQNNGLALMNICLGSNLQFTTKGGGIATIPSGSDRYFGILPDYPAFTTIVTTSGTFTVPSPSILERRSVNGGAEIVFEIPFVGLAGFTTNGLAAYDPRVTCC